jgi:uncharacterized RDD family membrane protein YckC
MLEEKYRTSWRRIGAYCIDALIFRPLGIFEELIIVNIISPLLVSLWLIFRTWIFLAYSITMMGTRGQTVGKIVCKVKVLDASTDAPISFRQALLRDSVETFSNFILMLYLLKNPDTYLDFVAGRIPVSSLPVSFLMFSLCWIAWIFIDLAVILTSKRRRAIHDLIAGTVVCKDV